MAFRSCRKRANSFLFHSVSESFFPRMKPAVETDLMGLRSRCFASDFYLSFCLKKKKNKHEQSTNRNKGSQKEDCRSSPLSGITPSHWLNENKVIKTWRVGGGSGCWKQ